MSARRTYLDYNATAPLRPQAREAMLAAFDSAGNASSVHAEGRAARARVEAARGSIAKLVSAQAAEVVFTSGATEAANWVLSQSWDVVLASAVEHPCVAGPVARSPGRVVSLDVDANGRVDLQRIEAALAREAADTSGRSRRLLIVQLANNETGVVQPIADIAKLARAHGVRLLVDAVQGAGRVSFDDWAKFVDYLLITSHKIGGPKGVGALIVRNDAPLPPLLIGGGQERGLRAGTESVEAIAGFGAAAEAALGELAQQTAIAQMRDRLERDLLQHAPAAFVIGAGAARLPNTSLVALPGRRGETIVIAFDLAGIAVSAGSACASGKAKRSAVLDAMGIAPDLASSAVRFSLGWATTNEDIAAAVAAWQRIAAGTDGTRHVA